MLPFLVALLLAPSGAAKGRMWEYTMHGTAYQKGSKHTLRNTAIAIGTQVVTTDSTGRYTLTISGIGCDRGTAYSIRRCNRKAYGTLVVRRLSGTASATIKSRWKRYAYCPLDDPGCGIQLRDLYVP